MTGVPRAAPPIGPPAKGRRSASSDAETVSRSRSARDLRFSRAFCAGAEVWGPGLEDARTVDGAPAGLRRAHVHACRS
jgi:hypothetical protein